MDPERLTDYLSDGHATVERGGRRLIDHLDFAAKPAQVPGSNVCDVLSVIENLSIGRFQQAQNTLADGGLAGARFADQAEGLALLQTKTDIVHRAKITNTAIQQSAANGKILLQVIDFQQTAHASSPYRKHDAVCSVPTAVTGGTC